MFHFKAKASASNDNLPGDTRTKDNVTYTAVGEQLLVAGNCGTTHRRRTNSQSVSDLGDVLEDLEKRRSEIWVPPTQSHQAPQTVRLVDNTEQLLV